jgi:pimeloyl-ACP methyl ester carboxylesterase
VTEIQEHRAAETTGSFAENRIEADGFDIRYLQAGNGTPVVYFHGGGGLHISPALELLAGRFQLTAFELPGFGRSPENTRTQTLDQLAETMLQALDALGIDQPTLLGTSLGASTALRLALAHPDRATALVLESPSAFRPADWSPQNFTPEQLRAALFAHPDTAPPPEPPEIIQKQVALLQRLVGPNHDADLERRLRGFPMSTLVIFGSKDGLIPPQMGRIYKELMPNCSLVFLYDAAHEMQFDRPDAYAGVVGDFIERQEAFVVATESGLRIH